MRITGKQFALLLLPVVLVHCAGLAPVIIGTDGTLYAMVAKTMALSGNFSDLYVEGNDWLDKPHFPFWITALSFGLFGINTFAYKFPALLFTLLGAFYTFRLAQRLYNVHTARLAVLILLTSEHLVLSNNDVRAEPYLTGLVIAAVYHFYLAGQGSKLFPLVAGSLFAALAVMTKGIFVLIPIGCAIAGGFLLQQQWKTLLHPRWLLAALLILIFITPELYSLYVQFDLHPEKTVFGRQGVSGLRFFFWDSQFGRFMNTGPIKGSGDPFFFLHTLLWAFLPWCLFLYLALGERIRGKFREPADQREWFCFSGAVGGVLLFSLSRFQLPHYTNILFPFFAVCTAGNLVSYGISGRSFLVRALRGLQWLTIAGMLLLPVLLITKVMPSEHPLILYYAGLTAAVWGYSLLAGLLRTNGPGRLVVSSILAAVTCNFFLNLWLYPFLLRFQSGSEAAFWVNTHYPGRSLAHTSEGAEAYAFEFYAREPVTRFDSLDRAPRILYTTSEKTASMLRRGYPVRVLQTFSHFHISKLSSRFLNAATRPQSLRQYQLVELTGSPVRVP